MLSFSLQEILGCKNDTVKEETCLTSDKIKTCDLCLSS